MGHVTLIESNRGEYCFVQGKIIYFCTKIQVLLNESSSSVMSFFFFFENETDFIDIRRQHLPIQTS